MRLEFDNRFARPVTSSPEERAWLTNYLAFPTNEYRRRGRRLMTYLDGSFPSGFVPQVCKAAKREGIQVEVADQRWRPCAPAKVDLSVDAAGAAWMAGKYDYQSLLVRLAVERGRGVLWVPTAGGKSDLAAGVARSVPCRWLYLVDSAQLVADAADKFERRVGEKAGRIGDGRWSVERFTAATFQSLAAGLRRGDKRALELLASAQGAIFDEVHTLPADQFWNVQLELAAAFWRIGLSATPLSRGDRRNPMVIGATGPILVHLYPEELIRREVLSRPLIRMVKLEQEASPFLDYEEAYEAFVARSHKRNRLLAELAVKAEKPALAFVKFLDHGELLLRLMHAAGLRAEMVDGAVSVKSRRAMIERLVAGELQVIVSTAVFNKGIDIPSLRSVIMGAGDKSVIASVQRLGRGSRVTEEGKRAFEVWDVWDEGWDRWGHAAERAEAYRAEGYEVHIGDAVMPVQLRLA